MARHSRTDVVRALHVHAARGIKCNCNCSCTRHSTPSMPYLEVYILLRTNTLLKQNGLQAGRDGDYWFPLFRSSYLTLRKRLVAFPFSLIPSIQLPLLISRVQRHVSNSPQPHAAQHHNLHFYLETPNSKHNPKPKAYYRSSHPVAPHIGCSNIVTSPPKNSCLLPTLLHSSHGIHKQRQILGHS